MTRRSIVLGMLGSVVGASAATADYAFLSPAELTAQSALIVTGTFLGSQVMRRPPDGQPLHLGILQVTAVAKGDLNTRVVLLELPPPRPPGLMVSDDIILRPGQTGVWYLRQVGEGLYAADHPARFVPTKPR